LPQAEGVSGAALLWSAVRHSSGNPGQSPSVSWTSRSPAVADVFGSGDTATVTGDAVGSATIVATSGTLADSITIQVTGAPSSVATVAVQPASANLAVGDTLTFSAVLR